MLIIINVITTVFSSFESLSANLFYELENLHWTLFTTYNSFKCDNVQDISALMFSGLIMTCKVLPMMISLPEVCFKGMVNSRYE